MSTTPVEKKTATSYIILEAVALKAHLPGLREHDEEDAVEVTSFTPDAWRERATVEAPSAEAAIRKHLGDSKTGGQYVAIPARSWSPVTVSVETQTRIKLETA